MISISPTVMIVFDKLSKSTQHGTMCIINDKNTFGNIKINHFAIHKLYSYTTVSGLIDNV